MKKNLQLRDKILIYAGVGVAILAVIVFALLMYSKNLNDSVKDSTINLGKINSTNTNSSIDNNTESASTEIGKNVTESQNKMANEASNSTNTTNSATTNTIDKNSNSSKTNTTANKTTNASNTNTFTTNNAKATAAENEKKELSFEKPVDGEIVREYAKDNLIYSPTLDEWTTHMGIDIKADKTTVVKAAEAGTIKSIKNDPRYGLTIVIEHGDNFQTVYSNLLTSEFVVEGENVEKGQSIGTVGNTGVFEIADEPHLHFEMLKDSLQVDPTIYLK